MLEVQEILELERKWRVYDKQRKNSKGNKDKKYQTYMLVAILAASVTTASLVFFYFEDMSINIAKNSSSTYEIKNTNANQMKTPETILKDTLPNTYNNTLNNDNIINNESTIENNDINDMQQSLAKNDLEQPIKELKNTNTNPIETVSSEITGIRKEVILSAPTEETINLNAENVSLKNDSPIESQKVFKFEIQSSNLDISVDELKTKFDKSNSSDLAVLIAKKYYDIEDYKNSEKWALIANELDSDNEESWVIFAKSKYNLGQKYDAVKVLRIYNDKTNSKEIEDLIKHIESNAI
ncbi:transformation system protein [Campylobacter sp. RM16187]|uniref:transformation system protein n=1 Tax=Campylobacter sp. RM16187 TaxID=1660063 RepID=UPI0021B64722|nr:transformation system protein [Campylobacter sp. RM16187]QKG29387.1 hypothetical protein CDOMF_1129 [Campylobacter sp. RM16187]